MIRQPFGRRSSFLALFTLVSLCLTTRIPHFGADAAYVLSIPAHDEECFVIASPGTAGGILHGNFDHLSDDKSAEPVSVVIIDAKEETVLFRSRRRASEGIFRITLKRDQKVNLCLQNGIVTAGRGRKSKSTRTHDGHDRVIGFEYSVEVINENKQVHSQNEKNQKAAAELHRGLLNLVNHHQYMRIREGEHREVVESTFSQLMWWVVFEGIIVIAIAGVQILYFKNFLERRRYM